MLSTPGESGFYFLLPTNEKLFSLITRQWNFSTKTFTDIHTNTGGIAFSLRKVLVIFTLKLPFGANRTRCQDSSIDSTRFYTEQWWHGALWKLSTHWSCIYVNTKVVLLLLWMITDLTTDWDAAGSHPWSWCFLSTSKMQNYCPFRVQKSSTENQTLRQFSKGQLKKSQHTNKMKWM